MRSPFFSQHVLDDVVLEHLLGQQLLQPGVLLLQAAQLLRTREQLWYGLAPEGTRKRVERWKPGFWKIAKSANVPILRMYLHYPDRVVGFGPLFHPGADLATDMAELREWYRPWMGKNRGTV